MSDEVTAVKALAAEIEKANPQLTPATPAEAENRDSDDPQSELPLTEADDADDDDGEEGESEESEQDSSDETPEEPEKPQRPRKRRRAQARINELVTQRREAEALAQKAAEERDHWRQQAIKSQPEQPQQQVEERTLADFDFDQGQYTEYLVDRRMEAEQNKQRQQSEQKQEQEAFAEFGKRAEKFKENTPDFEEIALQNPLGPYYPKEVIDVIRDSSVGPQLAYYLGQNLDKTDAILRMTPMKQALELGKIEARLEGPPAPAPSATQPPPRSTTRAPAVGSTVRGTSSASVSLEAMSVKDHIEALRVNRR